MRFKDTVQIDASRARVWAFLMDPNQAGGCGPGVESMEVIDADHFKARAKVGIGFISPGGSGAGEVAPDHAPRASFLSRRG